MAGTGLFVTGTGTGVGKTQLAEALAAWSRLGGPKLAVFKPVASGGPEDWERLAAAQGVRQDQVGQWRFRVPLAPLVAARVEKAAGLELREVVSWCRRRLAEDQITVFEGVGGVRVPMGEGWTVLEWVQRLGLPVVVVGNNRLGVINEVWLTVEALRVVGVEKVLVVLMDRAENEGDRSCETNPEVIESLVGVQVVRLGEMADAAAGAKIFKKQLATILGFAKV